MEKHLVETECTLTHEYYTGYIPRRLARSDLILLLCMNLNYCFTNDSKLCI